MKAKSVVIISDMHCGAGTGLTHPDHQCGGKVGKSQAEHWDFFASRVTRNPDVLIIAGDAIDGDGRKNGGVELKTPSRLGQVDVAFSLVEFLKPHAVAMVYGTKYHVGERENFEEALRNRIVDSMRITCTLSAHEMVAVNGLTFDVKHKVGSSQVPHGRHTPIARERVWNLMWAADGERQVADVLIRAHVHYYGYCGDRRGLNINLPSLQALGSDFGSRECSGTVDYGWVEFEVESRKSYIWHPILKPHVMSGVVSL